MSKYKDVDPGIEARRNRENLEDLYRMLQRMSDRITPAPNPEPGIKQWFTTDIPMRNHEAIDSNNVRIPVDSFEAKLHEQDSRHIIWEFRFFNKKPDASAQQVRGLLIKDESEHQLFLSSATDGNNSSGVASFLDGLVLAGPDLVEEYYGEVLYVLEADIRILYDGWDSIGCNDRDYSLQSADWAQYVQNLAENGATVPGIVLNGVLLPKKFGGGA